MDQEHTAGTGDGDGAGRRRFLAIATGAATAAGLGATAGCAHGAADGADGGTGGAATGKSKGPTPGGPAGFDVKAENAKPGHADWHVAKAGPAKAIEGFADKVSVLPGESFGLHVSTTAPRFTVSAYRMGWYGGARARLVWRSEALPGVRQPEHTVDSATRMVRTRWPRTTTVDTKEWPEGCYLLRLDAQGGEGQRFVPVTVRSAATAGRTVVVNSVATWQAYNRWGGYGSYDGPNGAYASRSLAVTFDRPYEYDDGAGLFLVYEALLLALAERLGIPLAYTTTTDVAREKRLLEGAAAVLSLGHDEYWSPEQRAHFTAARDAGTNIAILGANCCFRRIRLEPSDLGPDRTVVCYKSSYDQDPGFKRGHPATVDFRSAPGADPESSLLGVIYDGYPVDALRGDPPRPLAVRGHRSQGGRPLPAPGGGGVRQGQHRFSDAPADRDPGPLPRGVRGPAQPPGHGVLHGGERRGRLRDRDHALGGGPGRHGRRPQRGQPRPRREGGRADHPCDGEPAADLRGGPGGADASRSGQRQGGVRGSP